jgi:hypothetical protein
MIEDAIALGNDGAESDSCRESEANDDPECLLDCDDECGDGGKCCPPSEVAPAINGNGNGNGNGSKATSSKASSQR